MIIEMQMTTQYWEIIKINIKEISQRYSIKKNGEKRNKRKELDKQLSNLENEYINNPNDKSIIDRISSVKSELKKREKSALSFFWRWKIIMLTITPSKK